MKKALLIASLLLIAAGCNQNSQSNNNASTENTQTTAKSENKDSTKETYKSSDNPFTFTYPASWSLSTIPGNAVVLRSDPSESNLTAGLLNKNSLGIEIGLAATNNNEDIKTWCEYHIAKLQESPSFTTTFSNGKIITVSGEKAYIVDYQVKEDTRLNGRQICVEKAKEKYILSAYPLDSSIISDFNDIVSSFKFTN